MFSAEMMELFRDGFGESLYMTGCATLFAYVLGLPWGVILAITDKEGICPNRAVYNVLDVITNVLRSIPFIILLVWIQRDHVHAVCCCFTFHCTTGGEFLKGSGSWCNRGGCQYGRQHMADYFQGAVGGGTYFFDRGCNHCTRHDSGILCDGR